MEMLPEVLKEALKEHGDGKTPFHMIVTPPPVFGVLTSGKFDAKQLAAITDSPVRRKVGKLLEDGNALVFLVLGGKDEAKNKAAEKVARDVAAKAAAGEIAISFAAGFARPTEYIPEPTAGPTQGESGPKPQTKPQTKPADGAAEKTRGEADAAAEAQQPEAKNPNVLKVAVVSLSRTDPAEKWLVKTLMLSDPGLEDFQDDTLVFTVYGRGRAMPPFARDMISIERLAGDVMFVGGACSCTIKGQNPGFDLLMKWDWEPAVKAILARNNPYGDAPYGYQEFSVDEPPAGNAPAQGTPAGTPPSVTPPKDTPVKDVPAKDTPAKDTPAAGDAQRSDNPPDNPPPAKKPTADPSAAKAGSPDKPAPPVGQDAAAGRSDTGAPAQPNAEFGTAATAEDKSARVRRAWPIGLGLASATLAVVVAGLVFTRRHRPDRQQPHRQQPQP
jgi:hypothetical protein